MGSAGPMAGYGDLVEGSLMLPALRVGLAIYARCAVGWCHVTAIPKARLVEVPNAGHNIPSDDPRAFRAVVREFLGLEL